MKNFQQRFPNNIKSIKALFHGEPVFKPNFPPHPL